MYLTALYFFKYQGSIVYNEMVPKVKNEKESTLGILKASDIMAEVCRGGRSSLNH